MPSFPILDVAIGLSFVYLLLALICTTVNEMIAGWLKTRAAFLDKGIQRLLGDDLKRSLYDHPLIASLAQDAKSIFPSYIPANKFATALMDVMTGAGVASTDVSALRKQIQSNPAPAAQALNALLGDADLSADQIREKIASWFDDQMDRVSGWYKRNAQRNAMILAILITLILNASTLRMAQILWETPAVRTAVVEAAKIRAQQERPPELLPMVEYPDPNNPTASKPVNVPKDQALTPAEREALGQLTGWYWDLHDREQSQENWYLWALSHLAGWAITALAVSLGAPFWFDTLNRFMSIRNAGRAPDEKRAKNAPAAEPEVR